MLKMEGLAAALVESGWREGDSNMPWHWSVLNLLSVSFFIANLPPLSSMRKVLLETFLHIRDFIFIPSLLLILLCYYSADHIFNFSNILIQSKLQIEKS